MWSLKAPRQKVPRRRGLQSTLHQISRDTHLFPHVLITRSLVQFKTRKTKNKTKNMLRSLASFLPSLPSSEIPNETPHLGEVDRITFSIFFRVGERTTWLSVRIEGYLRGVKEIKEAVCLTLENYWHSSIRRDCSNGQWHQFMTSMHAKIQRKRMCFRPNNYRTKITLQSLATRLASLGLKKYNTTTWMRPNYFYSYNYEQRLQWFTDEDLSGDS